MKERLKALNGITFAEWKQLKIIIDNRYEEIKQESIFNSNKDTFKELNNI